MQGAPFLASVARSGARPAFRNQQGKNFCVIESKKLNGKSEFRSDVRAPRLENHETWGTLAQSLFSPSSAATL
jgi:hypothetical protein